MRGVVRSSRLLQIHRFGAHSDIGIPAHLVVGSSSGLQLHPRQFQFGSRLDHSQRVSLCCPHPVFGLCLHHCGFRNGDRPWEHPFYQPGVVCRSGIQSSFHLGNFCGPSACFEQSQRRSCPVQSSLRLCDLHPLAIVFELDQQLAGHHKFPFFDQHLLHPAFDRKADLGAANRHNAGGSAHTVRSGGSVRIALFEQLRQARWECGCNLWPRHPCIADIDQKYCQSNS